MHFLQNCSEQLKLLRPQSLQCCWEALWGALEKKSCGRVTSVQTWRPPGSPQQPAPTHEHDSAFPHLTRGWIWQPPNLQICKFHASNCFSTHFLKNCSVLWPLLLALLYIFLLLFTPPLCFGPTHTEQGLICNTSAYPVNVATLKVTVKCRQNEKWCTVAAAYKNTGYKEQPRSTCRLFLRPKQGRW